MDKSYFAFHRLNPVAHTAQKHPLGEQSADMLFSILFHFSICVISSSDYLKASIPSQI